MKILTWNCNGCFRNKVHAISSYNCDLYIIQECEDPSKVIKASNQYFEFTKNHIWVGESKNKGLGVFTKPTLCIERTELNLDFGEYQLKWFIPFSFEHRINFIAAWAHRGDSGEFRYIGQFYKMLCNNITKLKGKIYLGDLNSNKQWDYKRSEGDHSTCVKILENNGIYSVYHQLKKEEQGKESQSTFLLQKNKLKPYHIDYIFSPLEYIEKTCNFDIPEFDNWLELSDHVPVIWEFNSIKAQNSG